MWLAVQIIASNIKLFGLFPTGGCQHDLCFELQQKTKSGAKSHSSTA
jgi:hypothetical protein